MLTKQIPLGPLLLVVRQAESLEPPRHRRIGLIEGGVRCGRSGLWRGTHGLPPGVSGFWAASSIDREVDRLDDRVHGRRGGLLGAE